MAVNGKQLADADGAECSGKLEMSEAGTYSFNNHVQSMTLVSFDMYLRD